MFFYRLYKWIAYFRSDKINASVQIQESLAQQDK
jgi:hypothetical protein